MSLYRMAAALAIAVVVALVTADAVVVPGYAIVGARIVRVAGATIDKGTVVIRGGEIVSAESGDNVPGDVQRIDGTGLTVYPGLIDLHALAGVDQPSASAPDNPESREVTERFRRQQLLRAHVQAADLLNAGSSDLAKLADAGFTNALVVPRGDAVAGYSAFIDVVPPEIDPQVGRLAVDPGGPMVVRPAVALHVAIPGRSTLGTYPASLMGGIAFVRQAFLDARHYQQASAGGGAPYDQALAAMAPALGGTRPVAFEASTPREIRRALAMAKEFSLTPVIVGAHGAAAVVEELKAAGARVVLSVNYPTRPKSLAPDADESLEDLDARAAARKAAAALAAGGVPFGFGSAGLKDLKEFVANVRAAVAQGLSAEAAIRALTLDAATLAGTAERLGSIERGKRANLVVTDGDLIGGTPKVKHLFVAGRRVPVQP
jgi:imidazolonepropionase-like amidohydrolase